MACRSTELSANFNVNVKNLKCWKSLQNLQFFMTVAEWS